MRMSRPFPTALALACACCWGSAHADISLSIESLQSAFAYSLGVNGRNAVPVGIDNQGNIVGTLDGQDGWLLPGPIRADYPPTYFVPIAPPSGGLGGVVGLSLNSGQVLVSNQNNVDFPRHNDLWLGTLGANDVTSWSRLTDPSKTNGSFLQAVVATGLADDGRVLFHAASGGSFVDAQGNRSSNGVFDPQTRQYSILTGVPPGSYSTQGTALLNGHHAVINDVFVQGSPLNTTHNGSRLIDLNTYSRYDPTPASLLPAGTQAVAMNSSHAVIGGSSLYSPSAAATVDLKSLVPASSSLKINSVTGLNDHGLLVGTATNGDPILMRLQGTLDYIGSTYDYNTGLSSLPWSSAFALDLAPKSELDFRVLPDASCSSCYFPEVPFANLGLDGATVRNFLVGPSPSTNGSPVHGVTLSVSSATLSTVQDFRIQVGNLRLSGTNRFATGGRFVNGGTLELQSGDTTVDQGPGNSPAMGTVVNHAQLLMYGGTLHANVTDDYFFDPTCTSGCFYAPSIEVEDTGAGGQARITGNISVGKSSTGLLLLRPAARLQVDGNLSQTEIGNYIEIQSTVPGSSAIPGARLVVKGDLSSRGGKVFVEQGTTLQARSFTQNVHPNDASAGLITIDGELDTYGGDVNVYAGVLNGTGTINTGVTLPDGTITNGHGFLRVGGASAPAFFRPGHSPGNFTVIGGFILDTNGVLELQVERQADGSLTFDHVAASSISFLNGATVRFQIGAGVLTDQAFSLSLADFLDCGSGGCSFSQNVKWLIDGAPGATLDAAGNGFTLHLAAATVPEPTAWWLCLLGLGVVAARRRGRPSP